MFSDEYMGFAWATVANRARKKGWDTWGVHIYV